MSRRKSLEEFFGGETKFNMLEIIGDAPYKNYGKWSQRMVLVRCECGTEKEVGAKALKNELVKSCGCASGKIDRTLTEACGGLRHQFFTVIGETFSPKPKRGRAARLATCLCNCGNEFSASPSDIRFRNVRGCGCRATKHGLTDSAEYGIWCGIKARCFNPNNAAYENYGGRGISLHPEWIDDFQSFYDHVGRRENPEDTLDRIDNEKGYIPGNLQWASRGVQAINRRGTINFIANRETYNLVEFANDVGVRPNWLYHQVRQQGKSLPQIAREMQMKLKKYIEE